MLSVLSTIKYFSKKSLKLLKSQKSGKVGQRSTTPYTICLVEPVLPFKSCSLKTIVFIFLVPFSSGLSWKIILIHRWSTLWWNFVFLSCEFGADRSFLAPCWDLLTNPLAPERSVTSGWCFWGSCWYLLPSHGAQLDKQWWGLRVHTLSLPPQSQCDLEWLTESFTIFSPLKHDRVQF